MPSSSVRWWKLLIIGSVLLAAAGCSTLRVAYSNGPTLAWWQLDGWIDADRSQAPAVRAAIGRWFDWHRSTQLGPTTALLAEARALVMEPVSAETVCRLNDRVQALTQPWIGRALAESAELVPLITEANLQAMADKGAAEIAEDREQFLQADPAERRAAQLERARKRFERLYGRLDAPQLAVLRAGLAELPLDTERWLAERERRQRETVATLRRLRAEQAPPEQARAALAALVEARTEPADPAQRARQQRLSAANCELSARLHNATTTAQRERARDNLSAWETDLRVVMRPAAGSATAATVP